MNLNEVDLKQIKRVLLRTTISLFTFSAVVAIIIVLGAAEFDSTIGRIIGTTTILGLLSMLSMNNVDRLDSESIAARSLSAVALVSNLVWAIPWLLLGWEVFDYTLLTPLMRVILTAGVISSATTSIAHYLNLKRFNSAISALRVTAILSTIFLGSY